MININSFRTVITSKTWFCCLAFLYFLYRLLLLVVDDRYWSSFYFLKLTNPSITIVNGLNSVIICIYWIHRNIFILLFTSSTNSTPISSSDSLTSSSPYFQLIDDNLSMIIQCYYSIRLNVLNKLNSLIFFLLRRLS